MSDAGREFYEAAWSSAIAASEGRAKRLRQHPVMCPLCGTQVVTGRSHASCEPGSLAGMHCICPTGCTDRVWGDGGNCSPSCQPCLVMRGRVYVRP